MKLKALIAVAILAFLPSAVFAQGGNSVSFNGITFNAPSAFGSSVNIMQVTGDPVTYEAPGGPDAKHVEFVFYQGDPSTPVPAYYDATASMRVYALADTAGYTFMEQQIQALQALITQRPSLDTYMAVNAQNPSGNALPYLPVFPAGQIIRARAAYVETPTLKGVVYLTHFAQDVSPIITSALMYTFQGISNDGRYYVSATMRPATSPLPDTIPDPFDYDQFMAGYVEYLGTTVATLNAAPDSAFSPALTTLDAMVQSITFAP